MVSYRGRVTSQPTLPGAWNFRDVSETTGALRPGRLFRSSELSRLEDGGREELVRLGVSDVADLRSPREVTRRGPGLVPTGVGIHLLPFPDLAGDQSPDSSAPHEDAFRNMMAEKPEDDSAADVAARYMLEEYERFPTLAGSRRAVQRVVSLLASGRPVLAHCFAGKDRTGFVVAVVLRAAGVDRDAVVADYLHSNTAVPVLRDRIMEMIRERPETEITPEVLTFTEARLSDEVLGVRADYLDAAERSIETNFGSFDGFLQAAGVTDADRDGLRSALRG
ncbi:tyrosine-protein phosphatase [Mycolicibacter arupensis]|uniref:Phosphotyrosine protein phosphatase n=2 Tax=Mycolicibacter arupensis TaxID=342002 RepID=A0A0F5MXM2_9MYCO|nr:tyrosine-protein phosphatase [Mycolicibacter arupensis]KKB99515.1 phosphotyrosine protein phosphatase [Mycolicibacter arupensis]MCV7277860.1 tyrosine-protein phosphatase [Mycolicibacter arupensis]OQZ94465.1 phosphotyrosine protein phosphatase [Mycolicibacter arupensis]TXI48343.1 MAG: tyrosine-protein phosphatase [Mycolicibacter arupensis]